MTAVRSVGAETLNLYLLSMNGFERKTHSNKLDKRSPTNIFNCIVQYMRILGLVSASRPIILNNTSVV